ncbi:unnamed protein product [Effrenium voratum]|nr:unnamed protein product [Effrenium voratum]
MYKHQLDPHNTVGIFVPNGQDEESINELATAMCGEKPEQVLVDEKAKMALVSFAHTAERDALDHENVLLWDVPSSIHRLHMFGSGRYRFFVEKRNSEEEAVELFKPIHPFMLQWDVLTHPGDSAKKKPPVVKGMCDWRNPLGFACHVDTSLPATEFVGCCASVQGLEGGAQAFVAGSTVLPLQFLPLLLATMCPERWDLHFGVDVGSGEVRALRILHHELVSLPPKTLSNDVLECLNDLREQLREALYPASWWEEEEQDWHASGASKKGRKDSDLLDPPDLSPHLKQLLEVLPEGALLQRPKKMRWRTATTFSEGYDEDDYLRPLQPFSLREAPHVHHAHHAHHEGAAKKEFQDLVQYLTDHGECSLKSLPKGLQKTKKQLEKRPDLFELQNTRRSGYMVRLAAKAKSGRGANASTKASGREKPLVDAVVRLLKARKGPDPMGLGELGSQDSVKHLLQQQKSAMQKIRGFLNAFPDLFEMGMDANGQMCVQLFGAGYNLGTVRKRTKGPNHSVVTCLCGSTSGSGRRKGGTPSILSENISSLCAQSPATEKDFDGRVKAFLLDVQDKEGEDAVEECFEMLQEWLSKKEERGSINNWPAYIMKLLVNWKNLE